VSKKNRRTGTARPSQKEVSSAFDDLLDKLLAGLWEAMRAGDLLQAEDWTAQCLMLPRMLGLDEDEVGKLFVDMATKTRTPEDVALLRLIALLGRPAVKRAASQALGTLTAAGIYAPEWVAERAIPGQAWRRYDEFGDAESIIVTFSYGEQEHAFSVHIDLTSEATVELIGVAVATTGFRERLEDQLAEYEHLEEISLAEARRHLEQALDGDFEPELPDNMVPYLPILRSRIRRLPSEEGPAKPEFTAADRAAAVAEFMQSPQAAEAIAADEEATRFWAEVLTGYSSRNPGEPPAQVGPLKLAFMITDAIPRLYPLTEAQRRHLRPALTAWARWSAAYRSMDEAAAEHMIRELPEAFEDFDDSYNDPENVAVRAYVADVAASDSDLSWLAGIAFRRSFAMPLPAERASSEWTYSLDAGSPAGRLAYAAAEFVDCTLPDSLTREQFIAAVQQVVEELWQGEPVTTWQRADRLRHEGTDRHNVIHALVTRAIAQSI
jgi:hypothetical protein